jgi:L-malate glycosyltransferase
VPSSSPLVAASSALRVLFLDSIAEWGGGQKWCVDTALCLRARGHFVRIACNAGSELERHARERGLEVVSVGRASVFKLARELRRARTQIVVANVGRDLRLAAAATRLVPAVLVQRRGIARPLKRGPLTRWLYTRGVERVVANCGAIRAAMLSSVDFLEPERVVVIPNAVDTARTELSDGRALRAELGLGAHTCAVGAIARLAPMKGHVHLLRAWKHVVGQALDAVLLVAGVGVEERALHELAAALELGTSVRFLGFRRDLDELHAALDVLCLPSVRDEGCNNTLLESMAHAKPAVATLCGGLPEQIVHEQSGLLVPIADERALAQALSRLITNPALRVQMGACARERARTLFSFETVSAAWEQLFFELRAHGTSSARRGC